MDNNTTLDQRSLPWTINSSMDDLQMSMDDQTVLRQMDEYTTLRENFRLSIAVTKSVTIAMNPSSKLTSVSSYNSNSR